MDVTALKPLSGLTGEMPNGDQYVTLPGENDELNRQTHVADSYSGPKSAALLPPLPAMARKLFPFLRNVLPGVAVCYGGGVPGDNCRTRILLSRYAALASENIACHHSDSADMVLNSPRKVRRNRCGFCVGKNASS